MVPNVGEEAHFDELTNQLQSDPTATCCHYNELREPPPHQRVEDVAVGPNAEHVFDDLGGKAIEIEIILDIGTAREAGLCVLRSQDGREKTRISIFNQRHMKQNDSLQLDICESSLRTDLAGHPPERAPFRLSRIVNEGEPDSIRPVC